MPQTMTCQSGSTLRRWRREEVVTCLAKLDEVQAAGPISLQDLADQLAVPRSTLWDWVARRDGLDASREAVAFFESPVGLAFLHQLLVAAHLVMNWMGTCGIRLIGLFLELAGLGPFIASSYGAQQKHSASMRAAIVDYGWASSTTP